MFKHIGKDAPASLVVFLVALPLCLGIALASGAEPIAGLIAGIIGGLIVAPISGSHVGVSGPAAGLAVIVYDGIQEVGFEAFLLAVVIGGLAQLVLGIVRAGVVGKYFPSSVISGMLAAIGIIIFIKQIPHGLGYAGAEGTTKADKVFDVLLLLGDNISYASATATVVTFVCLAILLLWETSFMKAQKFTKVLSGSLTAVLAGIAVHLITRSGSGALTTKQLVDVPTSHAANGIDPSAWGSLLTFPDFSAIGNSAIWILAATIAVVASLETLLCVEATDKLDPEQRITPTNRELLAQGVGNTVSGLIGGLPITQVIVRSSANIQTGNATKLSAILHGAWLLLFFLLAPTLLKYIPLGSLAAVLFVVGYKLAKPATFKRMYASGMKHFIPFVVTILAIVFIDLLKGLGIGLVVALICGRLMADKGE
ncbi:MAG: SulP family inorganic anion transporter [Bacteroidota bacterium]|nr:SulP family inorganic anion transporter [Bacteroidota bacterium]